MMTTYERMQRVLAHQEPDRVPIIDSAWAGTIRRWIREGMPEGMDWRDYFGVDKCETFSVDVSARYPSRVIEETDRYIIRTNEWGTTVKSFKELDATPQMLDFKINDAKAWLEAKKRMDVTDDRIPWDWLKKYYDVCRKDGRWIRGVFWFGFDVTHSYMMGLETTLIGMMEEPELIMDIFETYLSHNEIMMQRIWDAGYHFDQILFYDDMGYKGTSFFSPELYKAVLQPYHERAVRWAHDHGITAELHSCGNIMTLIPEVVKTGVDVLNPMEVKAGMDPMKLKKEYGDRLTFHGGINAAHWKDKDVVLAEIEEKVPMLKENGGYIFASDHSIPNDVSLENMKAIVEKAKQCGKY